MAFEIPMPVASHASGSRPRNVSDEVGCTEEYINFFAPGCPSTEGLSHPHVLASELCFYLSRYRDNTTDITSRGPNCNRKVLRQSVCLADMPLSKRQERYKTARNTTKVVLEHKRSLRNENTFLSEGSALSRNPWYIRELKDVLEQASTDLRHTPPLDHSYMRKFVELRETTWLVAPLQAEDAEKQYKFDNQYKPDN